MLETLTNLLMACGIAGYEAPVRQVVSDELADVCELETDALGNLYCSIGQGQPHILVIAHMDEIGFVVTYVEDNGVLRFHKIGGIDDRLLPSRRVIVHTRTGPVEGVIGLIPPHLVVDRTSLKQVIPWHHQYIDLCTQTRAETEALGVQVMDPVTFQKDLAILNKKYLSARSLDDRFGCAVLIEVLRRLRSQTLNRKITFIWSTREEIGLHGAQAIGNRFTPDIVLAIDSFAAADTLDVPFHLAPAYLGKGPVLRVLDHRAIASISLLDQLKALAEEHQLPLQIGATGGATDGAAIQRSGSGAHMMALSIPIRYLHSTVELCHLDDFQNLIHLTTLAVQNLPNLG